MNEVVVEVRVTKAVPMISLVWGLSTVYLTHLSSNLEVGFRMAKTVLSWRVGVCASLWCGGDGGG
jgi:hypothetical protein